uniref:GATA-type domain-containing protein n=1 Tax=Mycena chlorophos TaxID=658473 RepID=A0ABQ0M0W2_MYCCL|nr:predicted protein [Mycena chlorophos]
MSNDTAGGATPPSASQSSGQPAFVNIYGGNGGQGGGAGIAGGAGGDGLGPRLVINLPQALIRPEPPNIQENVLVDPPRQDIEALVEVARPRLETACHRHNPETAPDNYCNLMLRKGRGFPLSIPGVQDSLPLPYQEKGVAIGDVGQITPDGAFDFFFNIFEPENHPINHGRVPPNFTPCDNRCLQDLFKLHHEPGNHVSAGSISPGIAPYRGFPDIPPSNHESQEEYPALGEQQYSVLPGMQHPVHQSRRRTYSLPLPPIAISAPVPQTYAEAYQDYPSSRSQRATIQDQYGPTTPTVYPHQYQYGGTSGSKPALQEPVLKYKDSPVEQRRDRRGDRHSEQRRAASMYPTASSSLATACPVCGNSDPTEWRTGVVSKVPVCYACAKFEKRNQKLRSTQMEEERTRRMLAGANR